MTSRSLTLLKNLNLPNYVSKFLAVFRDENFHSINIDYNRIGLIWGFNLAVSAWRVGMSKLFVEL